MTWIDLQEPLPRESPQHYDPVAWPDEEIFKLPIPLSTSSRAFSEALDQRRTSRIFADLETTDLAHFFWHTARIQSTLGSLLGFPQTLRPVASAGALHPIHVLVKQPTLPLWCRYEPSTHAMISLPTFTKILSDVEEKIGRAVETKNATVFLYFAEPGMVAAKYQNESSLVWRDVGALLGHSALVAADMRLAFCPLGMTGHEWAQRLNQQGQLAGVGVALLGKLV
jgi:hypothetical protein